MSMATRCTGCGTIFRVVQDQLKVSEGWVRCGRCDGVFNAIESLFDLEREAPPPWQPAAQNTAAQAAQADADDTQIEARPADEDVAELDEQDRIASRFFHPERDEVDSSPAESVAEGHRADFADARFDSDLLGDAEAGEMAAQPGAAPSVKPGFVRAADAQARWQTRRARTALSVAAVLSGLMLAMQAAHHFRDSLAAQWPQSLPLLAGWCGLAGCRIDAPRRIEDIAVENSAITHAAAGTDSFRLTVTLRNRAAVAVKTPSIDLSLTDTQGQLIARRALSPEDFGAASNVIAPGAEAALQALISAGNPRVLGYTVEVFYP